MIYLPYSLIKGKCSNNCVWRSMYISETRTNKMSTTFVKEGRPTAAEIEFCEVVR